MDKNKTHEKSLALFDFDKTITKRDSFLDFLLYTIGFPRLLGGSFLLIPTIVAFLFHLMTNEKAKEKVLAFYFKGMPREEFFKIGNHYSINRIPHIILKDALQRIQWHKKKGHHVVIISASLKCWLQGWCKEQGVDLICTEMEIKDGVLTGRLNGKNCYGPEKLRKINKKFDLDSYYIYAYGNSRGDKEMLDLADEKFYRYFKG